MELLEGVASMGHCDQLHSDPGMAYSRTLRIIAINAKITRLKLLKVKINTKVYIARLRWKIFHAAHCLLLSNNYVAFRDTNAGAYGVKRGAYRARCCIAFTSPTEYRSDF